LSVDCAVSALAGTIKKIASISMAKLDD